MTLERQLLEHAERCARLEDPDLARMLLADLPGLLALAHRDYAATRVLEIALAHLGVLLEHAAPARSGRPDDAVIVESVHKIGVRPTARLYNLPRSTVSDMAKAVRSRTPLALPPATPACTVDALNGVMGPGDVAVASLVHDRGAPTATTDKGDTMLGSNGREVVRSDLTRETLLARLEQLSKLPTAAKETADIEAARVQIRARLVQERDALIAALSKEGATLAKRVREAQHNLEWAAGSEARAEAQEALSAALLAQLANSCAQELKPAAFDRELRRTADPAWKEAQAYFEREMESNRAFFPPFIPTDDADKARMRAAAQAAPADPDLRRALRNGDQAAAGRFGPNIITIPFLNGGFDQSVLASLRQRSAALRDAHLHCRDVGPLLSLTHGEVLVAIARLKSEIPPVPADASTGMFPVEGMESRPAPATVAEGVFVDGVRQ
jgi:hypothetical protein